MTALSRIVLFLLYPITLQAADRILPDEIAPGVPRAEMMKDWLRKRAHEALDRREAGYEELKTPEDLEKWQSDRRAFFLGQIGGLPERTALNPRITGTIDRGDHRIEKLYFESRPGFHVTANLYLPKGKGPFPAVLHPTGHSANAKNRDLYQIASITVARGGCAVLCYDPIGQGERDQVFKPDGKPFGSTLQHTFINQGAHLLGSNTARIMIWDGMRAIDYLQSRPDIIPGKIGCTGISGGGTNTSYLMALDERILAAAPGCYLTGFRSLFDSIGPQDAEQNIHGQVAFGMDHSDYVLMRLPRPTLIMAATHDYFDIRGAWKLFREGKRFATRQGLPGRVDLVEPDTEHGFPAGMRLGAASWMRRWLLDLDEPLRSEDEPKPLPEDQLNVTGNARVLELADARSAFQLHEEWSVDFAKKREDNAKPENRETLLRKVRELINARELGDLPQPRIKGVKGGYIIEPESGVSLPAHLFGELKDGLAILLDPKGWQNAIDSGEASRLSETLKQPVLAVDLRGLGETGVAGKKGDWNTHMGANWKDTFAASLLNKSFVGMRTEDIWQTVRAWRKETGNPGLKVSLIASGETAIPALHAVALEPGLFTGLTISDSLSSWEEVVKQPVGLDQQSNLVFGALREYDLPVLRKVIAEKLPLLDEVDTAAR